MARLLRIFERSRSPSSKESLLDKEESRGPRKTAFQSSLWMVLCQIFGFLWLAPILTLLVLNFTSYTIGPSAWCFRGRCSADSLSSNAIARARYLDRADHNTLGALQFVAKGLELWFGFVAVNFIYNIATWLANRSDGLPLGLLTASVEVADPRTIFDAFHSARRHPSQGNRHVGPRSKILLGLFVALLAFMCILVNVMGPATAALVLPTLQWRSTPQHAKHTFRSFNLSNGPLGDNVFPECDSANLSQEFFSCNANSYAASLDSWVDLTVAGESQGTSLIDGSLPFGLSQEGHVFFTFNITENAIKTGVLWAPNRQVLREISEDLDNFQAAYETNTNKLNNDTNQPYLQYTNALQTVLKRQGPILGAYGNYYSPDNVTEVQVGVNQSLRCYDNYLATIDVYTKCIRVGTGWASSNKLANFTVTGEEDNETTYVSVYFSDKALHYNATWNPELIPSACLINQTGAADTRCPWDSIFGDQFIPPNIAPFSSNILTIELTMPNLYHEQRFVLELFTLAGYSTTYSLDTSPITDPVFLVQVDNIPVPSIPTVVDPNWFLAAWSVDGGGSLTQNRSAAIALVRGLKANFADSYFNDTDLAEDSSSQTTLGLVNQPTSLNPITNSQSPTALGTSSRPSTDPLSSPHTDTDAASTGPSGLLGRRVIVSQTSITSTSSAPTATLTGSFTMRATNTMPTDMITQATPSTTASAEVLAYFSTVNSATPDTDEQSYHRVDEFNDFTNDSSQAKGDAVYGFLAFSYLQALSMVDYSKDNITVSNATVEDPDHPKLHYYASVHVWAYGLNSRTSYFGVVVACAGMVCVTLSTILGLLSRRKQRSLTEILVVAIRYQHQQELAHLSKEEYAARIRYKVKDEDTDGRLHFYHVD